MQILPNSASSAAQILMQSAFSCALMGEPVSGELQTIHSPLSNIAGKRTQIASLYMAKAAKPCTTRNEDGQGKGKSAGKIGVRPLFPCDKFCDGLDAHQGKLGSDPDFPRRLWS